MAIHLSTILHYRIKKSRKPYYEKAFLILVQRKDEKELLYGKALEMRWKRISKTSNN